MPVINDAQLRSRDERARATAGASVAPAGWAPRDSEDEFRLLVSNVTEYAIFTMDPEGRVTAWNSGAERVTGYSAADAIGKPASIFSTPEDAAAGQPQRAIQAAACAGQHQEEAWRLRKDGSRYFAHVVTVALRQPDGSLRGFARITGDLGDRRVSGAGAERLAAIVESSHDAIIGKDLEGTIQAWNEGAERLYGYTRAEAVGRSMTMLVPPEGLDEYHAIMASIARGERLSGVEVRRVRKDGSAVDVSLSIAPVRDATGVIVGASAIARDITQRKRGEQALRRSEARLRAVLETAVDSIIAIDERGRIQSVNAAAVRTFGYTEAEMLGQNISMLMPTPYREEHDGYLARYFKTGERRIIGIGREAHARRKDGSVFAIDLAVSEVEPGRLFTGIIRDVSDRKLAEARVREADRMASIGTLAAGLGHDMNNVLLPVRARLNALKASHLEQDERQHVDGIAKSIAYLQQLADGLHFLAMDPDKEGSELAATDLRGWWSQTGPLISKAVPKHVKVTASWPADLPEIAVPAHALTQAVLNLVVNAGEAVPDRKRVQGRVRLWAEASRDRAMIRLGVTDNGRGMTEEVRRRALEMFYTTKPRGLGTGLGLALVRKVAERAGGTVEIQSQLGKGTSVIMHVPAATRPGEQPGAVISVRDGRAAALVRQVLESASVRILPVSEASAAAIWVIEPASVGIGEVQAWRRARPTGTVVLFGPDGHDRGQWGNMDPVTVGDRENFEEIRAAIGRAIARL